MNTLVKDGELIYQNFIDNGYEMDTHSRHGGLYYEGEMLMHEDIAEIAKTLGIETPILYSRLIDIVKTEQIKEQTKLTRAEIFDILKDGLKGFSSTPSFDPDLKFIRALIKVMDDNNILVNTNHYRSWLMPCSDQIKPLTTNDMTKVFESFLKAANHYPHLKTPKDIYDRFLTVLVSE